LFPFAAYHSTRELQALREIKGSWAKLCRFSNKVFVIHFATVLSSIILTVAYIEKIINPELVIGIDATVTWLFFIGMTFFFIVMASAFELFVRISMKQEKFGGSPAIVRLLSFSRYLIPFLSISMCSAFFLVVTAVYARTISVQLAENLIIAFWAILGVTALLLLITTPLTLHSACRDLEAMVRRHESDGKADDIATLSAKLHKIRRQSIFRGLLNTSIFFTMAGSSQARYWGPYVIGVQALLFSVIVLALSTLTSSRTNGSSSTRASKTMRRLGSKEQMLNSKTSKDDDGSKRSTKEELVVVDDFEAPLKFSSKQARVASSGGQFLRS